MNPGYVHIFVNKAMPDLIKIGFTNRSPEERKRELSRVTGVPLDFEIKYVLYTQDMKLLEQRYSAKSNLPLSIPKSMIKGIYSLL